MPTKKDLLVNTAVTRPGVDEVVRTPLGTEVIVFSPRSHVRNKVNAWLQDHQRSMEDVGHVAGYFPLWPILDADEVQPPPALTCASKCLSPRSRQRSLDFLDSNPMLATGEAHMAGPHRPRGVLEPSNLSEEDNVSVEFSQECASTVPDLRLSSPATAQRRGKGMRSASYNADALKSASPATSTDGRPPLRSAASSSSLLGQRSRRCSLPQLRPDLQVAESYRAGPNETLLISSGEEVMVFSPRLSPEAEAGVLAALTVRTPQSTACEGNPLSATPVVTITTSSPPSAQGTPVKKLSARSLMLLRVDAAVVPAATEGLNERVQTPQGTAVCVFSPKVAAQAEWGVPPVAREPLSPSPERSTFQRSDVEVPAAFKRRVTVPIPTTDGTAQQARQRRSSLAVLKLDMELAEPYRQHTPTGMLNETVLTPKGHEVMVFSPKVGPWVELPELSRKLASKPPALDKPERRSSNVSGGDLYMFAGFQFGNNDSHSPTYSSTSSNPRSAQFSGGSTDSSPLWAQRRKDHSPRSLMQRNVDAAVERPAGDQQNTSGPASPGSMCMFSPKEAQSGEWETALPESHASSHAPPAGAASFSQWPTYQPHEVQLPAALKRIPGAALSPPTAVGSAQQQRRRRSSLAVLDVEPEIAELYRERTTTGAPLNETVLTPTGHEVMVFSPKVGPQLELPDPVHGPLEVQLPPALHSPCVGPGSEASSRRVSFSADTYVEYRFGEFHPPSIGSSTNASPDGSPKFRKKDHSPRSLPLLRVDTAVAKEAAKQLNERVQTPQGTAVCVFSPKVAESLTWVVPEVESKPNLAASSTPEAPHWPTFQAHEVQLPAALQRRVSAPAPERQRSCHSSLTAGTEMVEPHRDNKTGCPLNETVPTPKGEEVMVFSPKRLPQSPPGPSSVELALPPALQLLAAAGAEQAATPGSVRLQESGLQIRAARRRSLPILNLRLASIRAEQGPLNELVQTPTGSEICVFSPKVSNPQQLPAWTTHTSNSGPGGLEAWPVFRAEEVGLPAALQPRPEPQQAVCPPPALSPPQ